MVHRSMMLYPSSLPLRRTVSSAGCIPAPQAFRDDSWVGTAHATQPARGPRCDRGLLVPNAQDLWALRALAHRGAPPPPPDLQQSTPAPFTAAGLEAMYRRAVPELQWRVEDMRQLAQGLSFVTVGCVPQRGGPARQAPPEPVFRCEKLFMRHPNGALELHAFNMFLQPGLRGRGLVAPYETLEMQLLQSLSRHPDTRLSLAAGYASNPFPKPATPASAPAPQRRLRLGRVLKGLAPRLRGVRATAASAPAPASRPEVEHGGYYVHGAHHYLFADDAGVEFPNWLYNWQDRCNQRLEMRAFFQRWLAQEADRGALCHAHGAPLGAAARAELAARVDACRTPHDFAMLRMPNVRFNDTAALGKACLTSGSAPPWAGVRFANPPQAGSQQAAARTRSSWGFAARALQETSRSPEPRCTPRN